MSTKIGSSRWIVVSGSAWPLVTSAPVVNSDRPMRPVIGAGTRVKRRLMFAVSSAARVWATPATAWRAVAWASVRSCLATASIAASGR